MFDPDFQLTPLRLFIALSLFLILLFLQFVQLKPASQNSLAFREGLDLFADFNNHVKYTCAVNVYTGDDLSGDFVKSKRQDRVFPPLAYLFYGSFKPILFLAKTHIAMLWVSALWSTLLFCQLLIVQTFMQSAGQRWEKLLFSLCIMFSGALLFAAERANIVIFSAVLSAVFLFHYRSGNPRIRELSLIALALAAGLKMAPAILGVLLLTEKRWREAARLTLYGIAAVILPFLAFPDGIENIRYLYENLKACGKHYLSSGMHIGIGPWGELLGTGNETIYYLLFGIAALAILLAFFEKEQWRKIFLLTLPMLFFPKESGYYNLLYLLPSLLLLCRSGDRTIFAYVHVVLFALVLTPFRFDSLALLPQGAFPPLLLWLLALSVLADSLYTIIRKKKEICHAR